MNTETSSVKIAAMSTESVDDLPIQPTATPLLQKGEVAHVGPKGKSADSSSEVHVVKGKRTPITTPPLLVASAVDFFNWITTDQVGSIGLVASLAKTLVSLETFISGDQKSLEAAMPFVKAKALTSDGKAFNFTKKRKILSALPFLKPLFESFSSETQTFSLVEASELDVHGQPIKDFIGEFNSTDFSLKRKCLSLSQAKILFKVLSIQKVLSKANIDLDRQLLRLCKIVYSLNKPKAVKRVSEKKKSRKRRPQIKSALKRAIHFAEAPFGLILKKAMESPFEMDILKALEERLHHQMIVRKSGFSAKLRDILENHIDSYKESASSEMVSVPKESVLDPEETDSDSDSSSDSDSDTEQEPVPVVPTFVAPAPAVIPVVAPARKSKRKAAVVPLRKSKRLRKSKK